LDSAFLCKLKKNPKIQLGEGWSPSTPMTKIVTIGNIGLEAKRYST